MASSENLASMEPWNFRTTFADSWFSARDTEALTKALQKSLSGTNTETFTAGTNTISPFLNLIKPDTTQTPTVSSLSGSDPETAPKRQRNAIPAAGGKVTKRKSRASKRTQTTFITADPANFRQLVQQVTGVRFNGSHASMAPILKPEPQRLGPRLQPGGCLPTLDTSAFLLDHHHQQVVEPTTVQAGGDGIPGPGPFTFAPPVGVVDGGVGLDFDSFQTFPTLESWKVM
ncbi:calmodulin-binding protein 25-like [Quillaja saponaria]|uniref:Calmodulin-binding protein 25-like n=1 Tax=Quillaja saponaria TaxID=32244 RepID=A0AAD7VI96_QUISA|nr:calmodulin-binding protein 25-like [Quillaja saponaria]